MKSERQLAEARHIEGAACYTFGGARYNYALIQATRGERCYGHYSRRAGDERVTSPRRQPRYIASADKIIELRWRRGIIRSAAARHTIKPRCYYSYGIRRGMLARWRYVTSARAVAGRDQHVAGRRDASNAIVAMPLQSYGHRCIRLQRTYIRTLIHYALHWAAGRSARRHVAQDAPQKNVVNMGEAAPGRRNVACYVILNEYHHHFIQVIIGHWSWSTEYYIIFMADITIINIILMAFLHIIITISFLHISSS